MVCFELVAYTTPIWRPSLVVDQSRKEKMAINFNITFPHMPCHCKFSFFTFIILDLFFFTSLVLNVDIMDDTGEHSSGYSQDVTKVRLDLSGKEIELGETVSK